MYQCVHYIKYTSIYKVHVPMCPLYKEVPLYKIHSINTITFLYIAQCTLHFELPEDYPETVPVMNITSHSKHVDPKIIETLLNETVN